MHICQNCGTTNGPNTRICRKCGALLPISTKSSRSRILTSNSESTGGKEIKTPPESGGHEKEILDLHEIPTEESKVGTLDDIPSVASAGSESDQDLMNKETQILQEITPKPFEGTILSAEKDRPSLGPMPQNSVSDAFAELKDSVLEEEGKKTKPTVMPIPSETSKPEMSASKREKLEKDMTEVLGFLSKKISVQKLETSIPKDVSREEPYKEIHPSSMNEILKELGKLDSRIEASAIIKTDGTMLASAISARISESLFSTIGINLSMISSDILHGLSAGTLKSISVRGSEGVLDLAPIDRESPSLKDMILILFSNPEVKSGIISVAVSLIKKQIKFYLGLEK
jgi:predicted regulator of Ras-like GTPase activity (Roadblock/LC7/MglB family)